jgi:hypothetical protein
MTQTEKYETLALALQKIDVENASPKYSGAITDFLGGIVTNIGVNFLLKQLAAEETREKLHDFVYWLADQTNDAVDAVLDKLIEYYTQQ